MIKQNRQFNIRNNYLILILFIAYFSEVIAIFSAELEQSNMWKESEGVIAPINIASIEIDSKGTLYVSSPYSLFRSKDDGKTWDRLPINLFEQGRGYYGRLECDDNDNLIIINPWSVSILVSDKDSSRIIFSGSYLEDLIGLTNNDEIIVHSGGKIYISNTERTKWSEINQTPESNIYGSPSLIEYDDNYGIIKNFNYFDEEDNIHYQTFYTTNLGDSWIELKKLPNSIETIIIADLNVVDSNKWLYYTRKKYLQWSLWNINEQRNIELNKTISEILFLEGIDNEFFLADRENFYKITEDGLISEKVNFGGVYDDLFKHAIDKDKNMYVGLPYKGIAKYDKENEEWNEHEIDSEIYIQFKNQFKYEGEVLYASDLRSFLYSSKNNGKKWDRFNLPKLTEYNDFDVSNNEEILLTNDFSLYFSSDTGKSWNKIDTNIYGYSYGFDNTIFFDDGTFLVSGSKSYFFQSLDSAKEVNLKWIKKIKKLKNGKYFGITKGKKVILFENDFSSYKLMDGTIKEYLGEVPTLVDFVEDSKGFVYLATGKGLFVTYDFEDKWTFIDVPSEINSISIDENDFIYLKSRTKILYSTDQAKTWQSINSGPDYVHNSLFLGFGNGNLVLNRGKVYYSKLPVNPNLVINSSVQNEIWNGTDGLIRYEVTSENGEKIDSATLLVYKNWSNEYDTLITNKNGEVEYVVSSNSIKSNVDKYFQLELSIYKDGFETYNDYKNSIRYNFQKKNLKINQPFKTDNYYKIGRPDTTITFEFALSDDNDRVINGRFEVENKLTNTIDYFNSESNGIGEYRFKIPINTPDGLYKLKFVGINDDNEKSSIFDTYIVVSSSTDQVSNVVNRFDSDDIQIYPNPTNDFINIESELRFDSVKILNSEGRLMFTADKKRIDISQLSSGLYYLVFKSDRQVIAKTFTVVK